MKNVVKSFVMTIILAVMLSVAAVAQNYSTPVFSADFNGAVSVNSFRNDKNTSTRTRYTSVSGDVHEEVLVVAVDHDIAVDLTSSRFYRDQDANVGETLTTDFNSDGTYQGRVFSYGCFLSRFDGVNYIRLTRYIIVNSRTALFISMSLPNSDARTSEGAIQAWVDFERTLVIK
jgi:hypothetical protein